MTYLDSQGEQAKYLGHRKAPGKFVRLEPDGVSVLDVAGVVDMAATVAAHTDPFLACELRDAFKMNHSRRGEVRDGVKFYVSWPRGRIEDEYRQEVSERERRMKR